MKRMLREPLLHFILPGAAIFAADSLVSRRPSGEPGKFVIAQGLSEHLANGFTTGFAKTWRMLGPVEGLTGILRCGLSAGLFFAVVSKIFAPQFQAKPK